MKYRITYSIATSRYYSYVKHGWWPFWRFIDQNLTEAHAMDSIKDYKRRLNYKPVYGEIE